jgi:hypothetical protein
MHSYPSLRKLAGSWMGLRGIQSFCHHVRWDKPSLLKFSNDSQEDGSSVANHILSRVVVIEENADFSPLLLLLVI